MFILLDNILECGEDWMWDTLKDDVPWLSVCIFFFDNNIILKNDN